MQTGFDRAFATELRPLTGPRAVDVPRKITAMIPQVSARQFTALEKGVSATNTDPFIGGYLSA